MAWISVGPLPEFYWAWKRTADLGRSAGETAAIMCFNTFPDFRGKGRTAEVLRALTSYGKSLGWKNIEGYPFDESAIKAHGNAILWPGVADEFIAAGFTRVDSHWLSSDQAERSIFSRSTQ